MRAVIEQVADGATILVGAAAVAAFVTTRLAVLSLVVALAYSKELRKAVPRRPRGRRVRRMSLARRLKRATRQRMVGAPWTVKDEYDFLSALLHPAAAPIPWQDAPLTALSNAYRRVVPRLHRSLVMRLRSTDMILRETQLARETEGALRRDADFTRTGDEDWARPAGPLAALLKRHGTHLMVGPPDGNRSGSFDEIRATLRDRDFGVPTEPFHVLARRGPTLNSDWGPAPPRVAQALDDRALALAQSRSALGADYNGAMARLVAWRVEHSGSSSRRRLHLLVERTNFISLVATNGGLHLRDDPALSHRAVRTGSLRHHLDDAEGSWTANALAVHLAVISSDRRLVLVQRSANVEWAPGQLNTAVNGVTELSQSSSVRVGDHDDHGFVDFLSTALREADEELGEHLGLTRSALVVRALALNDRPDQITPYVIMEARAPRSFDQIAAGHFAHVCRHEGAFEVGEQLVGLALDPEAVRLTVPWLRHLWSEGLISASGLATTLLTFGHILAEPELVEAWERTASTEPPPPVEFRAV